MTTESILLVGRAARNGEAVMSAHADRLRRRGVVDAVEVATYECEPARELRARFERVAADAVYAVPMCAAHTHETIDRVPRALSYVSGDVRYCEPIGGSPAVTEVLAERGAALAPAADDVSLVLVGFGSSSKPHHRRTADYHAERLRERTDYGAVLTCYLLQNPAVECVRYGVSTDRAVAVPLFLARSEATEERVPAELEVDRGGIEYAEPLGAHPRITDAVQAEVERQRALAVDDAERSASIGTGLTGTRRPLATDGDGGRR